MKPKRELIRVVHTPDGRIFLDETSKANGRGAYLCSDVGCLSQARKRKSLDRALKTPISDELYGALTERLQEVAHRAATEQPKQSHS